MRFLLIALALVAGTCAYNGQMLNSNRIPDGNVDVCGECKGIIRAIVQAIDDPKKLAELKILLSALCDLTPYAAECKLLVNTIDIFIRKLEPFMRHEDVICKKLHLCHKPKHVNYHPFKDAAQNDWWCDTCTLFLVDLQEIIDDKNVREVIKAYLEALCKKSPDWMKEECKIFVDESLPEIWKWLDAVLSRPKVTCTQLGFCASEAHLTPYEKFSTYFHGLKRIN